ncbi:MAG: VCBS repeat-containing protein [Bacteroidota bacterium]
MKRPLKITLIILASLSLLIIAGGQLIQYKMGEEGLQFAINLVKKRLGMEVQVRQDDFMLVAETETATLSDSIRLDKSIIPFKEIGATLGTLGKRNNMLFLYNGVTIFDANGDGKLDLFLPHSGRPIVKTEDDNHVLDPTTLVDPKPCALYINQGNNAAGDPIFTSVQDLLLQTNNQQLVREELMFENKYLPRESIDESDAGVGRIGKGALAGDFNGDGNIDLLILNDYFGVPMNKPNLGVRIYPANANLGRKAKDESQYIETTTPPFLVGDMKQGHTVTLEYGDKPEKEGRNTLLLNLGDKDQDGIPEWQDITESAGMDLALPSSNAAMGDIDRDGDLDIYIVNFQDPDFYGFGIPKFSGYRNELWINQLAETGKLTFKEAAIDYGVAGLHVEENLPSSMWNRSKKELFHNSDQQWDGQQVGEQADHSWAARLVDYNDDGYPDLIVANDVGNRLRVYENQAGTSFKVDESFHGPHWNGSWMGINSGDLDGDMKEDIVVANFGGNTIAVRNTAVFANNTEELGIASLSILNYIDEKYASHHALLSFVEGKGLVDKIKDTYIQHSAYIPPDASFKQNCAPQAHKVYEDFHYDRSIAGLEFAWNPALFDLENDGDLDIYLVGSLSRGNDGFMGDWTAGPGRLLVNETLSPGSFHFKDQTLEYQLMDISMMNYEANPPYRLSPGTGWHKKDKITTFDQDSYAGMGIEATRNSKIKDLFRMHENANAVYAADLNGDGFQDLVVPHAGGYNSTLPSARNLKINFAGKELAVPAPNKVIKAPTNFEEGPTFVYINQNTQRADAGNWIRIQLEDETFNTMAIGTKVIVNDHIMRRQIVGGESYGSVTSDLLIGLGQEEVHKLEIFWGSGSQEPEIITFGVPKANETIAIRRNQDIASR